MPCFPLAALLALLLAQFGETVKHAEMLEGSPVLTTASEAGGWTRVAVIGQIGCVLDVGRRPSEPGPDAAPERGT